MRCHGQKHITQSDTRGLSSSERVLFYTCLESRPISAIATHARGQSAVVRLFAQFDADVPFSASAGYDRQGAITVQTATSWVVCVNCIAFL